MKQMKEQIDRVKNMFEPVALRVSNLFFVLADLMTVDPMYQYSLDFFTTIYNRALKKADEKGIEKNRERQEELTISPSSPRCSTRTFADLSSRKTNFSSPSFSVSRLWKSEESFQTLKQGS